MNYPNPFVDVFAPMLDRAIPLLGFTALSVKEDPAYPYYSVSFRNDQVELFCELERHRPSVGLKRHSGEHWFQLPGALRALTGKEQNALDVPALTESFLEEYPRLIAALDTEPFNEVYLEQFSRRLGGYRPW